MTVEPNLFDFWVRIARPWEGQLWMHGLSFSVALKSLSTWLWTWVLPPHHRTSNLCCPHITAGMWLHLSGIPWMLTQAAVASIPLLTASQSWLSFITPWNLDATWRQAQQLIRVGHMCQYPWRGWGRVGFFFSLQKIEGIGQNCRVYFYRKLGWLLSILKTASRPLMILFTCYMFLP